MGVTKIGISLPQPLLEKIDTAARRKKQSRSEFVRQSLERALAEETPPHVLAEARALYAAIQDDDLNLAEDFITIAVETLPAYKTEENEV